MLDKNGSLTDDPYSVSRNDREDAEGNIIEGYTPNISETKVVNTGAEYETAQTAYARVLSEAGASLKRDATDKRIVNDVVKGTAEKGEDGMLASVEDTDYDVYENATRDAAFDANQNGIADWYEKATNKTDANADPDGDGFTNLEDYLNYIATPNTVIAAGETATFDLNEYFAGISGAEFSVSGRGNVSGTTLNIPSQTSDTGFLKATVTAKKGDVSISREFNVCLNGVNAIQNMAGKALVMSYEVYNQAGMLVKQGKADGTAVDRLNLQGVPTGVYIMKIVDNQGQTRSFSVIKK